MNPAAPCRKIRSVLPLVCLLASVALVLGGERIVLVAGGGTATNRHAPLPAAEARLGLPFGVDFDQAGNLYLVEMTGQLVRKIDHTGKLAVIAGTGAKGGGGDGGPALQAQFNGMHNLAVTADGVIYLADTWNNRVRRIDRGGLVATVAGTGVKGFSGDGGPAVDAQFGGIYCVSLDPAGAHLYLADLDNFRIRAVSLKTGQVRTVAGNGKKGVPRDGARATDAPLFDPRAVIADAQGRLYILERSGHALRVVETDGTITTVVGTGKKGFSGDGGAARQATLSGPKHLCFDRAGNVIFADTDNHVVRKYLPKENRIVRLVGTGQAGAKGVGGPPLEVELNQPHGVCVHADDTLYITDSHNHRVLRIER